jgi:Fic family protein
MGDLESFLNNKRIRVPSLVRIAIAHYQFETIHPFLDGNGRMGRLLVTLYLVSEGILDQPLLYLSAWFERDKSLYYDNLSRVRTHSDMVHWLVYFLTGIEQTAAKAVKTLTGILALKENVERDIQTSYGRRSQKALLLLQSLFRHPVTTVDQASGICDLSFKAANDLIHRLQMDGYLKEITGQSRNRTFLFEKYLDEFSRE